MKNIFLSIVTLVLLFSCKKENTINNLSENKLSIDSLSDAKTETNEHNKNQNNENVINSFMIDCGSDCAMTYNEVSRKENRNSVEIKYNVTQYINENPQDDYTETYVFESDSNGFLKSIHLNSDTQNILNDDDSLLKNELSKIGIEVFTKGIANENNLII